MMKKMSKNQIELVKAVLRNDLVYAKKIIKRLDSLDFLDTEGVGSKMNFINDMYSPLASAAVHGYKEMTSLLLKEGADPNFKCGVQRETALSKTVEFGERVNCEPIAEILLKAGADPNVWSDDNKRTPLMMAAVQGNLNVIELLINYGADIEVVAYNGCSAISLAKDKGNEIVWKILEFYKVKQNNNKNTQTDVEPE